MARFRVPAFLSFLLVLALTGCEDKITPTVLPTVDSKNLPQEESWDNHIVISDSGRTRAVIDAGYLCVYEGSQQTHMSQGVVVHFYGSEGQQTSVLTSKEAVIDEGTNNLEAIGNVVVVSQDSTKLKTEHLYWDNLHQIVHTPEFVRITSPKEKLEGRGFESDQSLHNYKIYHVTGQAVPQ
jgi:LPS export ABC transporter protein LptC